MIFHCEYGLINPTCTFQWSTGIKVDAAVGEDEKSYFVKVS